MQAKLVPPNGAMWSGAYGACWATVFRFQLSCQDSKQNGAGAWVPVPCCVLSYASCVTSRKILQVSVPGCFICPRASLSGTLTYLQQATHSKKELNTFKKNKYSTIKYQHSLSYSSFKRILPDTRALLSIGTNGIGRDKMQHTPSMDHFTRPTVLTCATHLQENCGASMIPKLPRSQQPLISSVTREHCAPGYTCYNAGVLSVATLL